VLDAARRTIAGKTIRRWPGVSIEDTVRSHDEAREEYAHRNGGTWQSAAVQEALV
jgi:hypothetical protein